MRLSRLKQRQEFLTVAAKGGRAFSRSMVLQSYPNPLLGPDEIRLGFTVTKKVGNAVVRNRVRRRLREASRNLVGEHGRGGWDYVFIGRKDAFDCPFSIIERDMRYVLSRAHHGDEKGNV